MTIANWLKGKLGLKHKCEIVNYHIAETNIECCPKVSNAHCSICGKKFTGIYDQGEYSKEWFWVYAERKVE